MPIRVSLVEALGLSPVRERLKDARTALFGDRPAPGVASTTLPRTHFGPDSLALLMPRFSLPLWRGELPIARKVVITNLFNHKQTPIERGWSVRRTQVEDYRGRGLTYDSHNGTDFAIPPGTPVLAPAPARVVRISTEFHRGGLKVVLDHGSALLTGHAHLSRVLVEEGAVLRRGEMFALSGMSGLDGFVAFPWLAPHVHFNVWLGEDYVDPFPHHGAASLFRGGSPVPYDPATFDRSVDANPESTDWDHEAVEEVLAGCLDPETRARLDSRKDPMVRAGSLFMERSYFPGRFGSTRPLARTVRARAPHLDLPFSIDTFDGVVLADEV